MLPLETPSEFGVGEKFTSGLFCHRRKHPACEYFLTWMFYKEGLLALRPTPKLRDHNLSAVHDCLFNLFAATLRSSIRNLRTRHAVATGTHYVVTECIHCLIIWFVDRASLCNLFQMKLTFCTLLLSILFQLLYMFLATLYQSSGELTVSIQPW